MTLVELPKERVQCRHLIGGAWLAGSGAHAPVTSPYTGKEIGTVPFATKAEIDLGVERAASAFAAWRSNPIKERSRPLFSFRGLLLQHLEEISHGISAESGKTLEEARAGVLKGVEVIEFALSLQNLDAGGVMEVSRGVSCQMMREPLGVVAGVTPFNFPAMVPLWLFPIAITMGNCFILKPSERVPLSSQRMGRLMIEAGFPAGVFSILNGGKDVAEALAAHEGIRAFAFVGSTAAAKSLYSIAASQGKRALCLGGAKNQLIVVPDASPEMTVDGVLSSFTGCAGQRCMAASVLIAVGDCDSLVDAVAKKAAQVRAGHEIGAIVSKEARERICSAVDAAVSEGAELLVDGRKIAAPSGFENGFWIGPTILDNVRPEMECARAEIFGPVLSIIRCGTLAEAMSLEAGNMYGNATSVFTTSGAVARYVSEHATSGMVGVNVGVPVPREPFSFGGTKASKFGHGDITGESALDFWTNRKKVTSKWALQADASWMG